MSREVTEGLALFFLVFSAMAAWPVSIGGMEASKWLVLCIGLVLAGISMRPLPSVPTASHLFLAIGTGAAVSGFLREGGPGGLMAPAWLAAAAFLWAWSSRGAARPGARRELSLNLLSLSTVAVAGTSILEPLGLPGLFRGISSGVSGNANLSAHYSAMAALLLAGDFIERQNFMPRPPFRAARLAAIAVSVVWVPVSGCRAAMAGLCLGAFLLHPKTRLLDRRLSGAMAALLVLSALIVPVLTGMALNASIPGAGRRLEPGAVSLEAFSEAGSGAGKRRDTAFSRLPFQVTGSVDARLCWWSSAAGMAFERPLFGHGPGGFRAIAPLFAATGLAYPGDGPGSRPSSPHSAGLETLCSFGLPGLACLALAMGLLSYLAACGFPGGPGPAACLAAWSACAAVSKFSLSAPICSLVGIVCLCVFDSSPFTVDCPGGDEACTRSYNRAPFAFIPVLLIIGAAILGILKAWDAIEWGTWLSRLQTRTIALHMPEGGRPASDPGPRSPDGPLAGEGDESAGISGPVPLASFRAEDGRGMVCAGNLHGVKGDWASAAKAYDRGLSLAPGDGSLWSNRALALTMLGRGEEALASAAMAVRINPFSPETWASAGNSLLLMGYAKEAMTACRRALECSPIHLDAAVVMARAEVRSGRPEDAGKTLEWVLTTAEGMGGVVGQSAVEEAAMELSGRMAEAGDAAGARKVMARAVSILGPRPRLVRAVGLLGGRIGEGKPGTEPKRAEGSVLEKPLN